MYHTFTIRRNTSGSYLKHYGVEGQQWGVRRGPPYPIDDTTMHKGEHLKSISTWFDSESYRTSGRKMYTFNANDKYDAMVYKGFFATNIAISKNPLVITEHEYEVTKDLSMPTKAQRMQEFKDMYAEKKLGKKVRKDLKAVCKILLQQNIGSAEDREKFKKFDPDNVKTEDDWKLAYRIFCQVMNSPPWLFKSVDAFMKRMAYKYDAMVDDNNQDIYNMAHDPVIIFRANEALKTIGQAKVLSVKEIIENRNEVEKQVRAAGRVPKL